MALKRGQEKFDTNGDGRVNAMDCTRLFKHVNKTQLLW